MIKQEGFEDKAEMAPEVDDVSFDTEDITSAQLINSVSIAENSSPEPQTKKSLELLLQYVKDCNVRMAETALSTIEIGEILSYEDEDGDTLLIKAAQSNNIKVMKLVVEKVNDSSYISKENRSGLNAIDIASKHGCVRAVEYFYEKQADAISVKEALREYYACKVCKNYRNLFEMFYNLLYVGLRPASK